MATVEDTASIMLSSHPDEGRRAPPPSLRPRGPKAAVAPIIARWRYLKGDPFALLLVLIAVGTPGLLTFGAPGFTRYDIGVVNVSSLTRIGLYLAAGYLFVMVYLAKQMRGGSSPFAGPNPFSGVVLVTIVYAWFALSTVLVVDDQLLLPLYRLAEWALLVLLVVAAMPKESYMAQDAERKLTAMLMAILSLPAIIVLVGTATVPNMALTTSAEYPRLGGWLFGPNGFGTTCAMGAVVFWMLSRSWLGKAWAAVLFVCMVLTYSRGAYLGLVASVLVGLALQVGKSTPGRRAIGLLGIGLTVPAVYLALLTDPVVDLLVRGESIANLLTLNMRTEIWRVSWQLASSDWLLGGGFILGPRALAEHFDPWFQPSTAHNDFLNAMLAGGVVAGVLVLLFYLLLAWKLLLVPFDQSHRLTYVMLAVQAATYAMITPVMSGTVHVTSVTLILLLRHATATEDAIRRRIRGVRSRLVTEITHQPRTPQ